MLEFITDTFPVPQSGSVTRSYWYQTTETLPALPAVTQGHTRRVPGCATVIGWLQVLPKSLVQIMFTELASGVAAPVHPPPVPAARSSVSHTTYTVPAESMAMAGQWACMLVPMKPAWGANVAVLPASH